MQDALAHTFFKMQHMATVHYENGHYHLHNELKTISEQDQGSATQKKPASEKTLEITWQQAIAEERFNFDPSITIIPFHTTPGPELHEGFIFSAIRPPAQA